MAAPTQDLIDRLGAAALDAREATREAHEARKDLRAATAEAREQLETMSAAIREATEERITDLLGAETRRVLDEVKVDEIGEGLRRSLARWNVLCDEAVDVLTALQPRASGDLVALSEQLDQVRRTRQVRS